MTQHSAGRSKQALAIRSAVSLLLIAAACRPSLANDFYGFIQADALPSGFIVEFEDTEPRFLVVRKKESNEFDAMVMTQRGKFNTYASRVQAIDSLASVACQSLKKSGYKVRQQENLLIYDDLTKPKNISILFSRKGSERPLAMRFWFQGDQAFCAAAHGLDQTRHWEMLQWISSIDASLGQMGEPVRFWRVENRGSTPAQLRWWKSEQVRLTLGGGKVLDVPFETLSRSDQRYVERSGLKAVTLEDTQLGFSLSLPIGFAAGVKQQETMNPSEPLEFIHLDGTSIRIQAIPQSRLSPANVANVLREEPANIQLLDHAKLDIRFSEKRAKDASRRTYVAFVGATSLVIETTALDDKKMSSHWPKIEATMRALRAI